MAQPPASPADETKVTAQRIEESSQDVPFSIVSRSADQLERQATRDVQTLSEAAPGIILSNRDPTTGEATLWIRGMGSHTLGPGTESSVGYYVDGVYMPRHQAFVQPFLDVERVEVLRGPRGVLWGRNSIAGAVNVVTRSPGSRFHGRLVASLNEFDTSQAPRGRRYELSATGPLSGKVSARLAGVKSDVVDPTYNEYLRSATRKLHGVSFRSSVTFAPSDSLTLTVRGDRTDHDAHDNLHFKLGDRMYRNYRFGNLTDYHGIYDPEDIHRIAVNTAPASEHRENGVSLTLDKAAGAGIDITSISSWREFDSARTADLDGTPFDFQATSGAFESRWWSQELLLHGTHGSASWIAGTYAFEETSRTRIDTIGDIAVIRYVRDGADHVEADLDSTRYAVYGQVDWQLSERVTLTTGARYSDEDKAIQQATSTWWHDETVSQALRDSWGGVTPRLGLSVRPRENLMLYATATAGLKSGGYNPVVLQAAFDEETSTTYEIGLKTALARSKVRISAAVFSSDYTDLQMPVSAPGGLIIENAAEARIRGIDLEFSFRPVSQFAFDMSFELLDDEFGDYLFQEGDQFVDETKPFGPFIRICPLDLAGRGLPRAPDLSASASLEYKLQLGAGSLATRVEYRYTDDIAFDPRALLVQPSYGLLHGQVRWSLRQGKLFVDLYGRNLTDEEYKVNEIVTAAVGGLRIWAPPREVGLQVGLDF
ncbi:MAG: TonB-dependent receptor [Acidobacteria bacterium]|nr:TonB-dependent receptor [Acidobacteriota bacterium]